MGIEETDDMLVRKCQRDSLGGAASFAELVRRYVRLVYAKACLGGVECSMAEDLAQEVFWEAYRSIGKLSRPEGFKGWLLTLTGHAVADWHRMRNRKKRDVKRERNPDVIFRIEAPAETPLEKMVDRERVAEAIAALRSLPEQYATPLAMRYLGGMGYEQIKEQLEMTDGALRGALGRGLAMMREKLKGEERVGRRN